MQQDLRANINIQNLLEINEQLKSDLIKYKPEFETEVDEDGLIIHMKLNGKVFTTMVDEDMVNYYVNKDVQHVDALCAELIDDLTMPFRDLIKQELVPITKKHIRNLQTQGSL